MLLRLRWGLPCCLALVGATLVYPVPAQGLGIRTNAPETVDIRGPQVLPYHVTFSAGAFEERFRVIVSPPGSIDGGYTMQIAGVPTVTGGGVDLQLSSPGPPYFGCSRIPGQQGHGYTSSSVTANVDIAPGNSVTMTFPFRTADLPIRESDSLAPSMEFALAAGETAPPLGPMAWPSPVKVGPLGVSFALRTKPGGPASVLSTSSPPPFPNATLHQTPAKRIRRGVPIDIFGKTMPALNRQKIDLIYTGPRQLQPKRLARVKTDAKGRFRLLDWTPKRPGAYEISARYQSRLPEIRSDYAACSKQLEIVRAK
jgi:hypothetical protein